MFFHYSINGNCVETFSYSSPTHKIKYDSVVDRSSFKPDSETTRIMAISGSGKVANPLYDTEQPTKLELAMRSGKLDKAEVQKIKEGLTKDTEKSLKELHKDLKKSKQDKIDNARQANIDSVLGFDSTSV